MALRVPQQYLPHIQSLLEFSDERIQQFLGALAKAGSKFNVNDLSTDVSNRTGMPRRIVEGVVQVLTNLYMARENQAVPLAKFLDEQVGPALKRAEKPEDKAEGYTAEEAEARWSKFRTFLMVALALDDTVGAAAKAGPVLTEHERIFEDARILTDVRPIFHPDLSEKPNAAVIVHMLRLTTRDVSGQQRQSQYFALDANDVRFMKQLMDRAITKEETLTKAMKSSGINIIAPKGFF